MDGKVCCLEEPSRKAPTTAMLEVLTKAKLGQNLKPESKAQV